MPYREARKFDDLDKNLVNKRSEIISQCCHKNKYRLKTLASIMTSGVVNKIDAFTLWRLCNVSWKSSYQAEDCKVIYMKLWVLETWLYFYHYSIKSLYCTWYWAYMSNRIYIHVTIDVNLLLICTELSKMWMYCLL